MGEVSIAREAGVKSLNAVGKAKRNTISMSNGRGGSVSFTLSSDTRKNEAMRFISEKMSYGGLGKTPSVDGFIREREGSFEVKVWDTTGRNWGSGSFGSIVALTNNTDKVLSFKKQRGRWTGTLKERRYYGHKDVVTKVF